MENGKNNNDCRLDWSLLAFYSRLNGVCDSWVKSQRHIEIKILKSIFLRISFLKWFWTQYSLFESVIKDTKAISLYTVKAYGIVLVISEAPICVWLFKWVKIKSFQMILKGPFLRHFHRLQSGKKYTHWSKSKSQEKEIRTKWCFYHFNIVSM